MGDTSDGVVRYRLDQNGLNLEGNAQDGDSGGAATITVNGVTYLVGANSGTMERNSCDYGSIDEYVRLSEHYDFITKVLDCRDNSISPSKVWKKIDNGQVNCSENNDNDNSDDGTDTDNDNNNDNGTDADSNDVDPPKPVVCVDNRKFRWKNKRNRPAGNASLQDSRPDRSSVDAIKNGRISVFMIGAPKAAKESELDRAPLVLRLQSQQMLLPMLLPVLRLRLQPILVPNLLPKVVPQLFPKLLLRLVPKSGFS